MTIQKCPKFGAFDHYVFFCLSDCDDFKGVVDGAVICNYNKSVGYSANLAERTIVDKGPIKHAEWPPTESAVDSEPSEFAIPVVDTGPLLKTAPKKRKEKKKDG